MEMLKISVIIPTYQHADTLPRCLDSVFAQTCTDFEVIVVDDGSTDNTEAVLEPYRSKITYLKLPHGGAPKARNAGFAHSKGDYVIFCDADVVMRKDMLQRMLDALKEHPEASYAYSSFRFGWKAFTILPFNAEELRRRNYIHTTSLIRRNAFPGFDEALTKLQDWDLWLTMLEKGHVGVGIKEILFRAVARKSGMSHWLPKIFYAPFLERWGIRFRAVERYSQAAAIVAKKHKLDNVSAVDLSYTALYTALFISAYVFSVLGYRFPIISTVLALAITAAAVYFSLRKMIYGVGFILSELIIGSLGGKIFAVHVGSSDIPLRMLLFLAVGAVWAWRIASGKARKPRPFYLLGVGAVMFATLLGMINGYVSGIDLKAVFSDANAYFALPYILFFMTAVEEAGDQRFLEQVLWAGLISLSVLTVAALFFFSHIFPDGFARFIYTWLRDTRIAEVTALGNGVYRVFIQSQLFAILGFLAPLLWLKERRIGLRVAVPAALMLIISLSRSFALGIAAGLGIGLFFLINERSWKKIGSLVLRGLLIGAVAVAVFMLILAFPLPQSRSRESFANIVRSRGISLRDAATASRWSLLEKLNQKIAESPVFGSGFGASVTYQSSDPRIVEQTGGTYTTSAFEWGYHDMVVKVGFLGLLLYIFLLAYITLRLMRAPDERRIWLVSSLVALLMTNIVSPYLNHPLGIGFLALLAALAEQPERETVPALALENVKPKIAPVEGDPAF